MLILDTKDFYYDGTPKVIWELLDKECFKDDERAQIATKFYTALKALFSDQSIAKKEEAVSNFFCETWRNYANRIVADILLKFSRLERGLAAIVPEEEGRYRDHFIHMFNTFVFGAILLSQVAASVDEMLLQVLFKVAAESGENFPFLKPTTPYSAKRRLLFLWTIMATAHDMGIPIKYLDTTRKGLDEFVSQFGLTLQHFDVEFDFATSCRINYYLSLMARMFDGGVLLETGEDNKPTGRYELSTAPNPIFILEMSRALERKEHGILGAICIFRSMERSFLLGEHEDKTLHLNSERSHKYVRSVFEQDITRAALAVALHSYEDSERGVILPISFERFPLAFLLTLCDILQEFYRSEFLAKSATPEEVQLLRKWPIPMVSVEGSPPKLIVGVKFEYEDLPKEDQELVISEYNQYLKKEEVQKKGERPRYVKSYPRVLECKINDIIDQLTEKLSLLVGRAGEGQAIELTIFFSYPGRTIEETLVG